MFRLKNTNLPSKPIVLDKSVYGLELAELGIERFRSTLMTTTLESEASDQIDVENLELALLQQFKLFILDGLWNITSAGFNKVHSPNLLRLNSYYWGNDKTYLFAQDGTINVQTTFYETCPASDASCIYEINLADAPITGITKVIVEGLEFKPSGLLTYTYNPTSKILLLTACSYCKPKEGDLVEIIGESSFDLSSAEVADVYEFDTSPIDLTVVYLEYKGKVFFSSNLINNNVENKLFALDGYSWP